MVGAAGDQVVDRARAAIEPHVVVRIGGVPPERVGQRAARHGKRHCVGAVRRLLVVDGDAVVDRRVGGDDDVLRAHRPSRRGLDHDALPILLDADHRRCWRTACPPRFGDRGGEPAQIFQRMEGRLVGVAQAADVAEAMERQSGRPVDLGADFAAGVTLGLELFLGVGRFGTERGKQIAVDAAEVAADGSVADDRLDAVDRRGLAFLKQPRGLLAPQLDQFADQVVADRGEMRRGARRHAAADPAAIQHHDGAPSERQLIRRRQAGDAGADHHHIGLFVLAQRRRVPRATSTSIQRDLVRSSLTFMAATPSPEMATPRLQLSFRDVIGRGHRTPQEHQRARHVDVAMRSSRRGLRVTPVTERNGHGTVLERHQDDG